MTLDEIRKTAIRGYILAAHSRERRVVCDMTRCALRAFGLAWTDAEHILQECVERAEWEILFGECAL